MWLTVRGAFDGLGPVRAPDVSVCLPSLVSILVCISHNRSRRQGVSLVAG